MAAHSQSFAYLGIVRLLVLTVSATITAGHQPTRPESKGRAYEVLDRLNLSRPTKKQSPLPSWGGAGASERRRDEGKPVSAELHGSRSPHTTIMVVWPV